MSAEPTTSPTPPGVAEVLAEGRRLLDACSWDPTADRLVVRDRDRALVIECGCGCGLSQRITGRAPAWAAPQVQFIAWAANAAPAVLAEVDALRNDLRAARSDFDAAMRKLGEARGLDTVAEALDELPVETTAGDPMFAGLLDFVERGIAEAAEADKGVDRG